MAISIAARSSKALCRNTKVSENPVHDLDLWPMTLNFTVVETHIRAKFHHANKRSGLWSSYRVNRKKNKNSEDAENNTDTNNNNNNMTARITTTKIICN